MQFFVRLGIVVTGDTFSLYVVEGMPMGVYFWKIPVLDAFLWLIILPCYILICLVTLFGLHRNVFVHIFEQFCQVRGNVGDGNVSEKLIG